MLKSYIITVDGTTINAVPVSDIDRLLEKLEEKEDEK